MALLGRVVLLLVSAPATSAPCTVRVLTRSLYTENGAALALRYTAVVRSIQQDTARASASVSSSARPHTTPRSQVHAGWISIYIQRAEQRSDGFARVQSMLMLGFGVTLLRSATETGTCRPGGEGPAQQNAPYGGLFPLNAPASAAGLFRSLLTGQRAHPQPRFPAGQPPNPSEPAYSTRNCGRSFPHSFTKPTKARTQRRTLWWAWAWLGELILRKLSACLN